MGNIVLTFLLYAALLGTVVTLVIGIFNMFQGTPQHGQMSNRLMRLRILLQGAALVVLALLLFKGH